MKLTLVLPALTGALFFVGCHMTQLPVVAQNASPAASPLAGAEEPKQDKPKDAPEPLVLTLQIAENPVARGKIVNFTMTLRNTTQETQTLRFNSGQSFDITATPADVNGEKKEVVWRWSHDKMFTRALRSEIMAPGQAKTWTATWNQTDNKDVPLPRGKYTIQAWITANGGLKAPPATLDLTD